jgi:hypothetical protein
MENVKWIQLVKGGYMFGLTLTIRLHHGVLAMDYQGLQIVSQHQPGLVLPAAVPLMVEQKVSAITIEQL